MNPEEPSQEFNPYAPAADIGETGEYSAKTDTGVTERTIRMMQQTRPWVIFFSVLSFVACGLMLLGACAMFSFMSVAPVGRGPGGAPGGMAFAAGFASVYVVVGLVYLVPGVLLWRYNSRIADFLADPVVRRLDDALEAQRSFWRVFGALVAIGIALYFLFLFVFVVLGIVGAMNR